ncbi:hypothetical protein OPV22_010550 [Ensete ventricosum]|uniref:RRM domain-containing protein n=1 Tax=Ensete ventricosum TaxID=4639 RepID=A0AAV8RII2_ENSVE|nr:hypothetical protein OPV22_010550 [Ensete ventricosum]
MSSRIGKPSSRLRPAFLAVLSAISRDTTYKPANREKMAFCSKLGGLIRQGLVRNGVAGVPNGAMHLLNAARYMSSTKLFVGGLSFSTDEQSLKEAFNSFGNVVEARVITDRDTGRSRGFGFVNFDSDASASEALSGMDGQELNGRNIRVSYANDRPNSGPRGGVGGGFGGSGGYGRNDF